MNPVTLRLPPNCKVQNFLYRTREPEYLVQDLVTVVLPNGYYLDVGWFPEHDPRGSYVVRVFREYWDSQQIAPYSTRNIEEVIRLLEDLSRRFSQESIAHSTSESISNEITVTTF